MVWALILAIKWSKQMTSILFIVTCQEPNKQTATKIGKHSFVEKNISTYKSGGYLTLQASLINWAAKI